MSAEFTTVTSPSTSTGTSPRGFTARSAACSECASASIDRKSRPFV
jgi:hypothetical protein